MSKLDVCDRCGAVIFDDNEKSTLVLELHGPLDAGSVGIAPVTGAMERGMERHGKADLCKPCGVAVAKIITTRIMTTGTNPDVFIDGRK